MTDCVKDAIVFEAPDKIGCKKRILISMIRSALDLTEAAKPERSSGAIPARARRE